MENLFKLNTPINHSMSDDTAIDFMSALIKDLVLYEEKEGLIHVEQNKDGSEKVYSVFIHMKG